MFLQGQGDFDFKKQQKVQPLLWSEGKQKELFKYLPRWGLPVWGLLGWSLPV
jgi:hypothetical protein